MRKCGVWKKLAWAEPGRLWGQAFANAKAVTQSTAEGESNCEQPAQGPKGYGASTFKKVKGLWLEEWQRVCQGGAGVGVGGQGG